MKIRRMNSADWTEVARIYEEGIATGMATFETSVPGWADWDRAHLKAVRLVADSGQILAGWAALTPVSSRCVYGGVAEVSIYIGKEARGNGLGQELLKRLIQESESQGIWTLQSGIFPENIASTKLHEKGGFRRIGYRERIGCLHGRWRDNILFERRSTNVGVDCLNPPKSKTSTE